MLLRQYQSIVIGKMWRSGRGLRTYQRQKREAREHGRAYRLHARERGIFGQPREQETGLLRELVAPVVVIRTSSKRVVSVPRETEGKEKEKDEGSLSISILPIESREIRTAESR